MRRLILLSLSCCLVTGCGAPSAVDRPDLTIAPRPCDPALQAAIAPEPARTPGAGILKPAPGTPAAAATDAFLNDVAALRDWAVNGLLPRVEAAKAWCDAR